MKTFRPKSISETATLAGGCFWCTEAIFKRINGVETVVSGYVGDAKKAPTYEQVCRENSGFTEAIQLTFNPSVVSFERLLDVFWATHNPTTLDQQGYDVGSQYRSVIYYHDENQKKVAELSKQKIDGGNYYSSPIVTRIEPITNFFPAENYHQNYYEDNRAQPYCTFVIDPKIKKLMSVFSSEIKSQYQNK